MLKNIVSVASIFAIFSLMLCALLMLGIAVRSNGQMTEARRNYVEKNCTLAGYYGRSGEYRTYNCFGRIMREEDVL